MMVQIRLAARRIGTYNLFSKLQYKMFNINTMNKSNVRGVFPTCRLHVGKGSQPFENV